MYDVVIVGTCTAGTYFAGLLAKRLNIVHFTRDSYEAFGVEPSMADTVNNA